MLSSNKPKRKCQGNLTGFKTEKGSLSGIEKPNMFSSANTKLARTLTRACFQKNMALEKMKLSSWSFLGHCCMPSSASYETLLPYSSNCMSSRGGTKPRIETTNSIYTDAQRHSPWFWESSREYLFCVRYFAQCWGYSGGQTQP